MKEYEWSYVPPENVRKNVYANQLDWNYTLLTIINEAHHKYYLDNNSEFYGNKTLIIPYQIMGLFYMLQYYDHHNKTLMGKYKIEICHEDKDYIECKDINSIIKINDIYEDWEYLD